MPLRENGELHHARLSATDCIVTATTSGAVASWKPLRNYDDAKPNLRTRLNSQVGARVTEEQELQVVKGKLAALADVSVTGRYSVQALRCSLTDTIEPRRHMAPVKE
jgi:hypothetical protein